MEFKSERAAITEISETIVKCGVSLYNAVKYIYSLSAQDFYNCNIRDALKIVLNNLTDADCLQAIGLRISPDRCPEMHSPEYNRVLSMMVYSFAVRLPALKLIKHNGDSLTENQIHSIYEQVVAKGADNFNDIIKESYLETQYLVKKRKPIPAYSAEWYKNYIYRNVPALSAITNKNMFLLGFVDVLFTMFYACMEEELKNRILALCDGTES